jgi:hypothetical protein
MAHRALGDAQFLGGAGEAHVPGGIFHLHEKNSGRIGKAIGGVQSVVQVCGQQLFEFWVFVKALRSSIMRNIQSSLKNDPLRPCRRTG